MNLDQFTPEERAVIEPEVLNKPEMRLAEWTGLGLRKAIRWRMDGKIYSATGLIKHMLALKGCEVHPLPGPQYWMVPDGRTLSQVARALDEDLAEDA